MFLIEFTKDYIDQLISWIPDEEFNMLWGGSTYSWPLKKEEIASQISKKEVHSFLLVNEDQSIGCIDLIEKNSGTIHLGRILVAAPNMRGKGVGKTLIGLAIDHAQTFLNANLITLAVFEKNESAVACYKSIGFEITNGEESSREFNGEKLLLLKMEKKLIANSAYLAPY